MSALPDPASKIGMYRIIAYLHIRKQETHQHSGLQKHKLAWCACSNDASSFPFDGLGEPFALSLCDACRSEFKAVLQHLGKKSLSGIYGKDGKVPKAFKRIGGFLGEALEYARWYRTRFFCISCYNMLYLCNIQVRSSTLYISINDAFSSGRGRGQAWGRLCRARQEPILTIRQAASPPCFQDGSYKVTDGFSWDSELPSQRGVGDGMCCN